MFVVYWCEHLRDGKDEGARVVESEAEALGLIGRIKDSFVGCNTTFRLFRLGEEIPLRKVTVAEPQPPKVKERYEVVK